MRRLKAQLMDTVSGKKWFATRLNISTWLSHLFVRLLAFKFTVNPLAVRVGVREVEQYAMEKLHTGVGQVAWQVWSVRYQGELLELWDPQNRDHHPQKRSFRLDDYHPLDGFVLISGHNMWN